MLDDSGVETVRGEAHGLAVDGPALDLDPSGAGHEAAETRNRQAALPALLELGIDDPDFRVDHDGRLDLGLAVVGGQPVGEEPEFLGDLRGGETDAVFLEHGADEISAELVESTAPEPLLGNRIGHRSQHRVAESDDLECDGSPAGESGSVKRLAAAGATAAGAAGVGGGFVGVVDHEPGAALVVDEVDRGAGQIGRRVRIDEDLEVAVLDDGVTVALVVEGETVGEARAADALDEDPQVLAFGLGGLGGELLDLG